MKNTVKIYQVLTGWEHYYTLYKDEAFERYHNSGESMKDFIEITIELTPDLLVEILNYGGMDIIDMVHGDVLEERHILEDI